MTLKITPTKKRRPRITVIYGDHGCGKSTLCATKWPKPVFIPTEDGLADIDAHAFPLAKTYVEAKGPLQQLFEEGHGFETVVIDSADWLEKLIWQFIVDVKKDPNINDISDIGFGKGYAEAAGKLRSFLKVLSRLRDLKEMNVVVTAHAQITKFEDPTGVSYDRHSPKLHKEASSYLMEWADEVFFLTYQTFTQESDEGFGRKRSIGVGDGERVLYTQERPGYRAKNRLSLPPEIMLTDFDQYAKFLTFDKKPTPKKKG